MASAPALPPEPAASPCPVCRASVEGARCEECGAALAPGGYRVERLITQSPRGRLYLARDAGGVKVAVKELVFASVPSVEEIAAFEREAKTLAQLSHPRIPRMVRFFEEGRGVNLRFYLVQTFIEGQSLLEALDKRRYGEKEARRVARQVLDILVYLHGLSPRVLHRDIKPANLLQHQDALFLVDFDCARDLAKGVTHQATLVGTFGYCPPEQLGGTASPSSDLYALGATLVHLLSRKPPADLLGPGMRLKFEDAVSVSAGMRAFLDRLLDADPAKRFQSAEEALKALDAPAPPKPAPPKQAPPKQKAPKQKASKQKAPPPPPPVRTQPRPAGRDHTPWLVVLGLGFAVTLTLLLLGRNSGPAPAPPSPPKTSRSKPKPAPMAPHPAPPPQVLTATPAPSSEWDTPAHEGATLPLDHVFHASGVNITARAVMANPDGQRPPDSPVLVRLLLQGKLPASAASMPNAHRRDWYGVDSQWPQYVTLLASSPGCVRCETVKPRHVHVRLEDGTMVEASEGNPSLLMHHREKLTLDSVIELSVDFEVQAEQFPISVRFQDGRMRLLPWTY